MSALAVLQPPQADLPSIDGPSRDLPLVDLPPVDGPPTVERPPLTQEQIEARIAQVSGQINRATADLVALVADALAREAWGGWGFTSANHWLRLRAGLSSSRAAAVLAAAQRHDAMPVTMGMFAQGRLTLDQVGVIVDRVPDAYEASVADMAQYATVPQLRRATKDYVFDPLPTADADAGATAATATADNGPTPEPESSGWSEPADACGAVDPFDPSRQPASLSMRYTRHGRFELYLDAPAHQGALVEGAVHEIQDALWHHRNDSEQNASPDARFTTLPRGEGGRVTSAEALVHLATSSITNLESASRADRYRVYVHLDTDGAWLGGRPRLPRHITQALTCDGVLQPVWHTDGAPVSVGRAMRIVPDRTRRLIHDRDRGCRFPGCGLTTGADIHHVIHWARGGGTDTPNLLTLCSRHHDDHHRGDFTIHGNADAPDGTPDAITFHTRTGQLIRYQPAETPAPDDATRRDTARRPDAPYAPPTGDPLHLHWVQFHPTG